MCYKTLKLNNNNIKSLLSIAKQWSLKSFLNIESDSLFLIDIGKLFQRRATLGKKDDLNNSVLAYALFLYTNIFYKNIEAEICKILRIF